MTSGPFEALQILVSLSWGTLRFTANSISTGEPIPQVPNPKSMLSISGVETFCVLKLVQMLQPLFLRGKFHHRLLHLQKNRLIQQYIKFRRLVIPRDQIFNQRIFVIRVMIKAYHSDRVQRNPAEHALKFLCWEELKQMFGNVDKIWQCFRPRPLFYQDQAQPMQFHHQIFGEEQDRSWKIFLLQQNPDKTFLCVQSN